MGYVQMGLGKAQKNEGMDIDEFIQKNADPIWLHQNEMWEYIQTD